MSSVRKEITQASIAERLNISRSTVAAVLCNLPTARISPEVRQRVQDTAAEMGYVPNRHAQIIRKGSSGIVGIVNFGMGLHVALQKLQLAVRGLHAEGFDPLVHDTFWFTDRGALTCGRMREARVEGVLLVQPTLWFTQKHLDSLLQAGIPVVSIGGHHLRGIPRIMPDKEQGFYDLTVHLLGLGYRRLTYLGVHDSSVSKKAGSWHTRNAIAGFQRAIKEKGGGASGTVHLYHEKPALLEDIEAFSPFLSGKLGMEEILKKTILPEAVLCSNDNWAMGALTACRKADLRLPEDMAITGFENEPVSAAGLLPLTTMAHPVAEIAQMAVEFLTGAIRRNVPLEDRLIVLPNKMIIRHSCGATRFSLDPNQKEKTHENQKVETHP